ncbi:MAG: hypothetical protein KC620_03860 [Myxococcales bacterium]|nr:hypothetical protein [Myxococcales bacterium]
MKDDANAHLIDWIVSGAQPVGEIEGDRTPDQAAAPTVADVYGLTVGTVFEIVRGHDAGRGRWRVARLDHGPRGTLRLWAIRPGSSDHVPFTAPQIRDALDHGWLLIVEDE